MIDLHAHVLPGVDDGPETIEDSLSVLRDAAADGTRTIVATPHVRSDYPTAPEAMERLVAKLREATREAGVSIELLPGGELDLEFLRGLDDASLARFGLGGNPQLLLVEFPYRGWPLDLAETLFQLRLRGFHSVLAHPERNADVQEAPERLRALVEAGTVVQLTAGSLDGRLGRRSERCARALLDAELAHVVASDAHAPTVRHVGLRTALEAVGDKALGRWLVADVPAALLGGTSLPPRPKRGRRARLRLRPGRRDQHEA